MHAWAVQGSPLSGRGKSTGRNALTPGPFPAAARPRRLLRGRGEKSHSNQANTRRVSPAWETRLGMRVD